MTRPMSSTPDSAPALPPSNPSDEMRALYEHATTSTAASAPAMSAAMSTDSIRRLMRTLGCDKPRLVRLRCNRAGDALIRMYVTPVTLDSALPPPGFCGVPIEHDESLDVSIEPDIRMDYSDGTSHRCGEPRWPSFVPMARLGLGPRPFAVGVSA